MSEGSVHIVTMYCANCGTELPDGARFCVRCGAPAGSPAAPPAATDEQTVQIRLWRGYVNAEFYAELADPDTGGLHVERSRAFRWRNDEPPPRDRDDVLDAYEGLVAWLQALGWEQVGIRKPWYAQRFRRVDEPLAALSDDPAGSRLRDVSHEGGS